MGCFYVGLCDYVDAFWEEDVGAKIGLRECLRASGTSNADVRLFLEAWETHAIN